MHEKPETVEKRKQIALSKGLEYMFNGFTECYSIDHMDLILDMMKGLNEK